MKTIIKYITGLPSKYRQHPVVCGNTFPFLSENNLKDERLGEENQDFGKRIV